MMNWEMAFKSAGPITQSIMFNVTKKTKYSKDGNAFYKIQGRLGYSKYYAVWNETKKEWAITSKLIKK